ncbi:MAG: glycosyltransferase family 2 protein [Thermoplasmata archaeon]
MASVLTIILNWNCAKDTMEAIDSVMASETEPHGVDIFLVDNGSKDNSVEILRKYFTQKNYDVVEMKDVGDVKLERKGTKKILFYLSPKNLGFTGGNNLGFEFALKHGYEFVFLLNADAVVNKDTIKVLVESFTDEKIACVGPKVYAYDYHGRKDYISFAGAKIDLWTCKVKKRTGFDTGQYDEIFETSYVEGCAMMIRTSVLAHIGLFDEKFFAYWEESDWCIRAKKQGYNLLYVPASCIWHKGVTKSLMEMKPHILFFNNRNSVFFAKKHCRFWLTYIIYWFFYTPFRFFLKLIIRTKNLRYTLKMLTTYWHGILSGLLSL